MEEDYGSGDKGLDRILALSDGIFAFSLTLLALSLVVPEITSGQSSVELPQKLVALIPNFVIFFWSFFVVSFYWMGHHRVFRFIQRYDGVLIWCNLVLLMFITLVPFITNLDIQYGDLQVVVVLSAIFYSIPGFAISLIWLHSSRNRLLIDKSLPERMIKLTRNRNFIAPFVFVVSIPFSFIHPYATLVIWLLMFPLRMILNIKSKVSSRSAKS